MPQDQRLALSRISGAGAAPGDGMVWDGYAWKPGTVGIAYASLYMNFQSGGANIAGSKSVDAGSVTIDSAASSGDHGISTNGTTVTYAPGVYLNVIDVQVQAVLNQASTQTHQLSYSRGWPPYGDADAAFIGTALADLHMTSASVVTATDTYTPSITMTSTGTSVEFDLGLAPGMLYLTVLRLA